MKALFLLVAAAGASLSASSAEPVKLIEAPDQPITITADLQGEGSDETLAVSFVNDGRSSLRYVRFFLVSTNCSMHGAPSLALEYGDRAAMGDTAERSTNRPVAPHRQATILVPVLPWQRLKAYRRIARCSGDNRTQLILDSVAWCDGSGWQAVAAGPYDGDRSGRAWTPRPGRCE
jgi:hypothetical protein